VLAGGLGEPEQDGGLDSDFRASVGGEFDGVDQCVQPGRQAGGQDAAEFGRRAVGGAGGGCRPVGAVVGEESE